MASKQASPSASPVLTPQGLTPGKDVTPYSTQLWDERPLKYQKNVIKNVCIFLFVITVCEEIASFALGQSLKNFFQKLGWSNKGSTSMKLTYDALSQFACIFAGFLADQYLGKYKTLLTAASLDSIGLVLLVIGSAPAVLTNIATSKVIFNIGLFLGVAFSQITLRSLLISYGGDQFSPATPAKEKAVFFSVHYWVANIGAFVGYALFPSITLHGIGPIPAEYGYFTDYVVSLVMLVVFVVTLYLSRKRYVNVPPSESSVGLVIKVVLNHAKKNFRAQMVVLGTFLYIAAFLMNIIASFFADHGETGHHISYACGVCIVIATFLWVYYGRDSAFMDDAKASEGGKYETELIDGVKQVIRILPFNAFNVFWWVCQNQRGNNQSIIQQTDVRLGSGPNASQIPGPTVQMFNPIGVLLFVPLTEKVLYPLYTKYAGKPPSRYGKVLAGYCVAAFAMFWTGSYEIIRRGAGPITYTGADGLSHFIYNDDGKQAMNDIPWWTGLPHYLLVALAGVMIVIPSYDICYSEVPQSMRGTSIALGFFVNSMGSTLLSIIVLLFGKFITPNLNKGHMEYMFFTIGAIMILNIVVFVHVMKRMKLGMLPPVDKSAEIKN
ncbi:hypothetical protein Gpo141_00014022 [Globisporangium polare]